MPITRLNHPVLYVRETIAGCGEMRALDLPKEIAHYGGATRGGVGVSAL